MSKPIDETKTLEASGGDDTLSATARIGTDSAAFQPELSGSTTSVDVHVDARLDEGASWVEDYIEPRSGKSNGWTELRQLDVENILEIRVRIINQDGSNSGTADAVVRTE